MTQTRLAASVSVLSKIDAVAATHRPSGDRSIEQVVNAAEIGSSEALEMFRDKKAQPFKMRCFQVRRRAGHLRLGIARITACSSGN